ncbi:DUF695 domain-containing protein [Pseudomonas canadensis]|uniref:DUF695 domain-containing protein n=1 Tax=Pseudomonas TaxID=286 RepID=UPI002113C18D|nr:DUF695 domain-containing protein [Pseudomonas sp. C 49-2]
MLTDKLRLNTHHRMRGIALASLLLAGCSHAGPQPTAQRDHCLDKGPANSEAFERCAADREAQKTKMLKDVLAVLDTPPGRQPLAETGPDGYQEADFPQTPKVLNYQGERSISVAEKQALPYKVRIIWKYDSPYPVPGPGDVYRMGQMREQVVPAVEAQGLAKFVCTVTADQQVQWIFYAKSEETFMAQVNAALAKSDPSPLVFTATKEPALSSEMAGAQSIRITPKTCME